MMAYIIIEETKELIDIVVKPPHNLFSLQKYYLCMKREEKRNLYMWIYMCKIYIFILIVESLIKLNEACTRLFF